MNETDYDPARLDVERFAKAGAELRGVWPVARFQRLVESVMLADGEVTWQARGESRARRGAEDQTWLHLTASARLALECQRCLMPVEVGVDVARSFRFVRGEEAAAQIDAESEDDVLALPRRLDLFELVEDEMLLALPLVPRHERCPSPLPMPADDSSAQNEARPNPFEVLRSLKRNRST